MKKFSRRNFLSRGIGLSALTPFMFGILNVPRTISCARAAGPAAVSVASSSHSLGSLTIKPGVQFAADSYVHTPLPDNAPIDSNSPLFVKDLTNKIRDNYGHMDVQTSLPIYVVGPDVPTTTVLTRIARDDTLDWGDPKQTFASYPRLDERMTAVPIPDDFYAYNDQVGSDGIHCIYQPSTDTLWEFWGARKIGKVTNSAGKIVDHWGIAWGGRMDNVSKNPGYWITPPSGDRFGANAAGIPHLAGIMTIEEMSKGKINHPLGFMVQSPSRYGPRFPAQRSDGFDQNPYSVAEGMMMRFPADLALDSLGLDAYALMICKAIQKYGMVCWDHGGVCGFRCEGTGRPGTYTPDTDPYWKRNGINGCPVSVNILDDNDHGWESCWAPLHFSNVPWDKLVVVDQSYFAKWNPNKH